MKAVLIPFKAGPETKSRLGSVLTLEERLELMRHLLADVAVEVNACEVAAQKVIVTADRWAARFAHSRGWRVLVEAEPSSESHSVDWASGILAGEGINRVLRLPADVPLVRAADVASLLAYELPHPGGLLVPSSDGTGTNALVRQPPLAFPACFGPGSRRLHQRAAASRGVPLEMVENPRLSLDIDTPRDLAQLLSRGPSLCSTRFLAARSATERFSPEVIDASS